MALMAQTTEAHDEQALKLSERRHGLRIRRNHPIKVYEPRLGRYFGGQTEDISSSGLRIELPASAPIRAGKILNVFVAPAAEGQLAHRRQMLPVRVVWTDRVSQCVRGRLVAGVEFLSGIAAQIDAA